MSSTDDPLLGNELAGYRIESVLSRGKAFDVYRAEQHSVDRRVALKFLSPRHAKNESLAREFLDGARAAAKLNHPNVVRVYDARSEAGRTFVSMELVDGLSLANHVAENGAFPPDRWESLVRDACRALVHAESSGVVHTALTPEHLLVAPDGSLKVLNLGLGLALESSRPAVARRKLSVVQFFSPERIRNEKPSAHADVYSLGCSLYFAMTGKPPFMATDLSDLIESKNKHPAPLPVNSRGRSSHEVARVVQRMTVPDPANRYADSSAALADLDERLRAAQRRRRRAFAATLIVGLISVFAISRAFDSGEDVVGGGETRPEEHVESKSESTQVVQATPPKPPKRPKKTMPPEEIRELENALRDRTKGSPTVETPDRDVSHKTSDATGSRIDFDDLVDKNVRAPAREGSYHTAIENLRKLGLGKNAANRREALAIERRVVLDLARKELTELRSRLEAARTDIELDGVESSLTAFRERAPKDLEPDLARFAKAIESRHEETARRWAELAILEIAIYDLVAGGEFDAARARAETIDVGSHAKLRERRQELIERVGLAEQIRSQLLRGARAAAGDETVTVDLRSADPDDATSPRHIGSVEVGEGGAVLLSLRRGEDPAGSCDLGELESISLFGLLRRGSSESADDPPGLSPADEIAGFILYLFIREGPVVAGDTASIFVTDTEQLATLDAEIDRLGRRLLASAVDGVQTMGELVAAENEASLEEAHWNGIRDAIDVLLRQHGRRSYFAEFRDRLAESFRKSLHEEFRAEGLALLFRGKVEPGARLRVQVTYGFDSPEELRDFVPLQGTVTHEKGLLVVTGECRLQHGNPFINQVRFSTRVPEYDPRQPNINIAVWTRPNDRVSSLPPAENAITPENKHLGLRGGGKDLPNDYLAFGLGYRLSGETLNAVGSSRAVATMPAYAILGGVRGSPLHYAHGDGVYYTYWAESVGNRLKGPQLITLILTPEAFLWHTRSMKLHNKAKRRKPSLGAWLRRPEELGSITLFTNGHRVAFDSIVLEADLHPDWAEAELDRRAQIEFDARTRKHGVPAKP